jgi:riboflavin biosynthesis pyrimidine reductase
VIASVVSSLDGRGTLGGTTARLSDVADRAIFRGLRGTVDALMVGTGTLREERYGRAGRSGALRRERAARGLAEEPTIMVVSRSLAVPVHVPLFVDPASRVRLYTSSGGEPPAMGASIEVTRLPARGFSLSKVLEVARAEHGIRTIDCEGGPTLLAALLAEDLVDELFVTLAPLWAGPEELPLVGPWRGVGQVDLRLVSAHRYESRLFLRYARH